VRCPWCDFDEPPRALHAHLGEAHPEQVRFEEKMGRSFYAIDCPICGDGYEQQIKPRGRDPGFVEEFSRQIRLVAFDMLVNHLLAEHGEGVETGNGAAEPEPETSPPSPAMPGPGGGPAWLVEARKRAAERPDS
jgi:hypothetical protein